MIHSYFFVRRKTKMSNDMDDEKIVEFVVLDNEAKADIYVEQMTTEGINNVLNRLPTGESLEFCDDCGEEIPLARRNAYRGVTRCITCQTDHEKRTRK